MEIIMLQVEAVLGSEQLISIEVDHADPYQ